jgi:hypothetical protein
MHAAVLLVYSIVFFLRRQSSSVLKCENHHHLADEFSTTVRKLGMMFAMALKIGLSGRVNSLDTTGISMTEFSTFQVTKYL